MNGKRHRKYIHANNRLTGQAFCDSVTQINNRSQYHRNAVGKPSRQKVKDMARMVMSVLLMCFGLIFLGGCNGQALQSTLGTTGQVIDTAQQYNTMAQPYLDSIKQITASINAIVPSLSAATAKVDAAVDSVKGLDAKVTAGLAVAQAGVTAAKQQSDPVAATVAGVQAAAQTYQNSGLPGGTYVGLGAAALGLIYGLFKGSQKTAVQTAQASAQSQQIATTNATLTALAAQVPPAGSLATSRT